MRFEVKEGIIISSFFQIAEKAKHPLKLEYDIIFYILSETRMLRSHYFSVFKEIFSQFALKVEAASISKYIRRLLPKLFIQLLVGVFCQSDFNRFDNY